jgi:CubicO group peptidase (beta-lactamase class C family)
MRVRMLVGLFGLLVGVAAPVVGAVPGAAEAASPTCTNIAPSTLAEFFDDTLPGALRHDGVPGAVVSVVSGNTTAFAKGYGVADVEHGTPFSESRSLVRIASISKLFTWTAVMQQVEAGRLDLNANVNRYLKDFQIPDTYPRPVTLRDLMDHTAGFEDYIIGTAAANAADVPPLGEYLARYMPARIRPPGEISAYSNYGAALAGYIVAQVSGEPFDGYVRRHLFDPLGMAHSTATEPVPAGLAADLARSYDSEVSPPRRIPFTFDPTPPDGSVSTTATDMANFMNAHLHDGRFGTNTILTPATTALMHERSFTADPRLDGYAHGFKERTINGHRVLMHDGGWEGFRSILMLVPGCDLGLFLSTNSTGGAGTATTGLVNTFFDRFAPADTTASTSDTAKKATAAHAGFYQPTRHNESTVEKVGSLLGPMRLTVGTDGTVHFKGQNWSRQADGAYRSADGTDRLVFLAGADGRRYVATDGPAYELMSRGETLPFNLLILLLVVVPALGLVALPLVWLLRRITRRPTTTTAAWRAARRLTAGTAVLAVVFLAGLTATLIGDTDAFRYHVPLGFRVLLGVPIVALGAAVVAAVLTVRAWRGAGAGVIARVHQVTLLTGMVALAWFVWQWNLFGWQYP